MTYRTWVAGTLIPAANINTEPQAPETVTENERRHRQWLAAHPEFVAEQKRRQCDDNQAWERWFEQVR